MAARLQIAAQPSLTAAEIEREPSRGRNEVEELIAMKSPVGVVPGRARLLDPRTCLKLPRIAQRHCALLSHCGAEEDSTRVERYASPSIGFQPCTRTAPGIRHTK